LAERKGRCPLIKAGAEVTVVSPTTDQKDCRKKKRSQTYPAIYPEPSGPGDLKDIFLVIAALIRLK